MTALADRPKKTEASKRAESRIRWLRGLVVVLVVALVGLGAWVVFDQTAGDTDAEIQRVLDDYYTAWNTRDAAAIRAVATEDYTYTEYIYFDDPILGFDLSFVSTGDLEDVIEDDFEGSANVGGEFEGWMVEQAGDPILRSEGPARLAAVNEDWISGNLHAKAQSLYTIVEEDGTLKILHHYIVQLSAYPTG